MVAILKSGPTASREFRRICELPTRNPQKLGAAIAEPLSEMLRAPGGKQTLRPVQALALAEAHDLDGIVALMAVGSGKTLVSYLLPVVLKAERPLLLVPAKLKKKTKIEFQELKEHWQRHSNYRIESYELVSRCPGLLDEIAPDLIVADESHFLKNKKSAVTKRVWRYWNDNDDIKFCPMSGTLAKRSFFDWWHLQCMALPDRMGVLPYYWNEAEHWANAMDEKTSNRVGLGALKFFGPTIQAAREGFGQHLKQIPGVITSDVQDVSASIYLERHNVDCEDTNAAMRRMYEHWELPDGTEIMRAADFWRHSKELGNGFYYKWTEEAPEAWLEARREANSTIRNFLRNSRKYETPAQAMEVLSDNPAISKWKEIEKTFKPITKEFFLTDQILQYAVAIAKKHKALLWYEHRAVGARLSEHFGLRTYANQALNIRTSRHIYDEKYADCIAVSIGSCSEGLNLQKWDANVILSPPPSGQLMEQLMGRTHRAGQLSDTVHFHVIEANDVQTNDFNQAMADARYIEATTSQSQKLTLADVVN